MTLTVDSTRCIGCGMCATAVPEVFQIVGHVSTVQALPAPKRLSGECNSLYAGLK